MILKLKKHFKRHFERKKFLEKYIEFVTIYFKCSNECEHVHSITLHSIIKKISKRNLYHQLKGLKVSCEKCKKFSEVKMSNFIKFEKTYLEKNKKISV